MKIENIKTESLVPYARNAKLHDENQVSKIASSIREFGFNNPVLVDGEKPPGIIAGHGRVLAAKKLGLAEVPCIRLAHLSEAQKRAYILADNRLAELGGGWDSEMLKLELADLGELDVDLEGIGFGETFTGAFDVDEAGMPELADGDKQPFQQMTFTVHDEQAEEVQAAIAKAKGMGHGESAVNENSNGNALAFICQSFNRA
jgi:ParB family chromosome partitioning protein